MRSRPAARPPVDAVATLLKMLRAEQQREFDDGAVSGGLDGYLRGVLALAEPGSSLYPIVAALPRDGYGSLSRAKRASWALQVVTRYGGKSAPRQSRRAPAASAPAVEAQAASKEQNGTRPRRDSSKSAPGAGLQAPVATLGRIQQVTVDRLARVGVTSVEDMLWYFPTRHVDFTNVKPIAELFVGQAATVIGTIQKSRVAFMGKGRRSTEIVVKDASGSLRVLWFNQAYLAKQMPEGARIGLAGNVTAYRGKPQLTSPEWELLDREESGTHVGRYVPVYALTQGLPGRTVRKLARAAVEQYADLVPESLPPEVLKETDYPTEAEAIRELHFPQSMEARDRARERLAFQELLSIQVAVLSRKREARARRDAPMIRLAGDFIQTFVDALPFELTNAQIRAITELRSDLGRDEPMARLLQGDVGSGKTVVAAAVMLGTVAAGYQAALMAPTEVLAEQHYATFRRIFGVEDGESLFHDYSVSPALGRPVRIALLTGATKAGKKRQVQAALKQGELDIVVGTHALITERVGLERLGLAVVDEQHRFGVMQRDALRGKGGSPHLLVMTATPIPRTLALTIYGDLDVSRLDEMPPGRQPIETRFIAPEEREEVYVKVREEVAAGRQVFVICPLVEESDAIEARSAVEEFERLRSEVFPDLSERMRLLHGRMASADKERAMADFRSGKAAILVSTAVVEVGVDVPNATVMLIEGADRFGLSQLHQFRGRVGRAEHQSFCYLLSESDGDAARKRLTLMERTSDGFDLAEADLEMRGPGEYFGTRQSGLPDLRVAKLTDHTLLLQARNYAERILERDPNLRAPEHQALARRAGRLSVEGAEAVH